MKIVINSRGNNTMSRDTFSQSELIRQKRDALKKLHKVIRNACGDAFTDEITTMFFLKYNFSQIRFCKSRDQIKKCAFAAAAWSDNTN